MKLNREKVKLVMARKQLGVSDIAERSGKCKQRISTVLNSVNVTPKTAGMIANALGVDITEILESN